MPWLVIILGYLLGSIPTGYIAGRIFKKVDIRRVGNGNMGAQNAFRQLGAWVGITVGIIDAGKGVLAILIAREVGLPQIGMLLAGAAAVIGHNWPVFLRFRGGRGEATTIGVLLTTITEPMLILAAPAIATLVIWRNVTLASAVLFVPLPFLCWWLEIPGALIAYGIALPCLVGFTHFLRTRQAVTHQV